MTFSEVDRLKQRAALVRSLLEKLSKARLCSSPYSHWPWSRVPSPPGFTENLNMAHWTYKRENCKRKGEPMTLRLKAPEGTVIHWKQGGTGGGLGSWTSLNFKLTLILLYDFKQGIQPLWLLFPLFQNGRISTLQVYCEEGQMDIKRWDCYYGDVKNIH